MESQSFEAVWSRVKRHEGDVFMLRRDGAFRYKVLPNDVVVIKDRDNARPSRTQFEKGLTLIAKATCPSDLSRGGVWGASYVFAILVDKRIRGGG